MIFKLFPILAITWPKPPKPTIAMWLFYNFSLIFFKIGKILAPPVIKGMYFKGSISLGNFTQACALIWIFVDRPPNLG